jgi:hypothetical protein
MASRKIGNAQVPPVGFGAMGISIAYGLAVGSDEVRFKVGINLPQACSIFIEHDQFIGARCSV